MLDAPAFHRNKTPMLNVLTPILSGEPKDLLEIASGSGQHGPFFTKTLENLCWWPSDISDDALASINGWRQNLNTTRVKPPCKIDVIGKTWRSGKKFADLPDRFDAILSMNMIHIAPFAASSGLVEGAAKRLNDDGLLILYGPFKRNGRHTAPSNEAFDQSLRSRNAEWGIRNLQDIAEIAKANDLSHDQTIEMPANNLIVVFRKCNI